MLCLGPTTSASIRIISQKEEHTCSLVSSGRSSLFVNSNDGVMGAEPEFASVCNVAIYSSAVSS